MSIFALNGQSDIIVNNGEFSVIDEGNETVQMVRSRLRFIRGTWFQDTTRGLPLFSELLERPARLSFIESVYKSEILNTEGMGELIAFDMSYDSKNRILKIIFSGRTESGNAIEGKLNV